MGLLTRDGHLLDLTLERYLAEDLAREACDELEVHLGSCVACQERLECLRSATVPLPELSKLEGTPSISVPTPAPVPASTPALRLLPRPAPEEGTPAGRSRPMVWLAPLLAAAAVLLVYIGLPRDDFQARGGDGLQLEVYRDHIGVSERLLPGAQVVTGDRLAFRVHVAQDGFLMVAGKDANGTLYPCYSTGDNPRSVAVVGSPDPQTLPAAIELDDSPGEELIFAVFCPKDFDLATAARLPLPETCSRVDVPLKKIPP